MRNWLASILICAAGCSDTGAEGHRADAAPPDLPLTDLSMHVTVDYCGDHCFPIGCADLIACTNACTTEACLTKCHKLATTRANALDQMLNDCIAAHCTTSPDGGTGPCQNDPAGVACNTCVINTQSGTSPAGMKNGSCAPVDDPVCGFCVDQLLACAGDVT